MFFRERLLSVCHATYNADRYVSEAFPARFPNGSQHISRQGWIWSCGPRRSLVLTWNPDLLWEVSRVFFLSLPVQRAFGIKTVQRKIGVKAVQRKFGVP